MQMTFDEQQSAAGKVLNFHLNLDIPPKYTQLFFFMKSTDIIDIAVSTKKQLIAVIIMRWYEIYSHYHGLVSSFNNLCQSESI
jgi:hypothetical protein